MDHVVQANLKLENDWQKLCSQYLPLVMPDSIWRISRNATKAEPEQGWKLHISATLLTACEVLEKVAPFLTRHNIQFKAPSSLLEVSRINCGLDYGYSQVGKVITVYPRSDKEAVAVAKRLYKLTKSMIAPTIPFDKRYGTSGCLYYRYGAFKRMEIAAPDGILITALRAPDGKFVPDARESTEPPHWTTDPFLQRKGMTPSPRNLIGTRYRAFSVLTQRGRGGVFMALDTWSKPPRLCILKEGRRVGELGWDGRDGIWRVRNELRVLKTLRAANVKVPKVYSSFVANHHQYVVLELIEGESLHEYLLKRSRRLSLEQTLALGVKLCHLLADIHAAGWIWRDFKPSNIILTPQGDLRPIDFEGACRTSQPDRMPWGTKGFTPPRWRPRVRSRRYEDLYGLGATLYLLLSGIMPDSQPIRPLGTLRRGVPQPVTKIIGRLLEAKPGYKQSLRSIALTMSRIGVTGAPRQRSSIRRASSI